MSCSILWPIIFACNLLCCFSNSIISAGFSLTSDNTISDGNICSPISDNKNLLISGESLNNTSSDSREEPYTVICEWGIIESEGLKAIELIFENVIIREDSKWALDFHIDLEEANAAGVKNWNECKIIK